MIRYRYNRQFSPPAPFVHVPLERPDGESGLRELPAQLDTAADVSVLPTPLVEKLGLVQLDALAVAAFGGTVRTFPTFLVRLSIHNQPPGVVEVLGSSEEPHILLGRDVLNQHRILLNGPQTLLEID